MTENPEFKEKKFEKWNDLPKEMKLECIKTLDFETRWKLRQTSKTERALVDSKKVNIDKGTVSVHPEENVFYLEFIQNGISEEYSFSMNPRPFSNFIWSHSNFEKMSVDVIYEDYKERVVKPSCTVNHLKLSCCSSDITKHFSPEKLENQPETVEYDNRYSKRFSFDKFISQPKIVNARLLQLTNLNETDTAQKIAQIWIQNDAEIGKKYQAMATKKGSFEGFFEQFSDRIVSKTDKSIRIRTDNPTKHILLELGSSDFKDEEYFRMTMISSEMKESEIDKNEQWVRELEKKHEEEEDYSDDEPEEIDSFWLFEEYDH